MQRRQTDRVRTRPEDRNLPAPVHDHADVNGGGPHAAQTPPLISTTGRWTGSSPRQEAARPEELLRTIQPIRDATVYAAQPGRDGLPRPRATFPNYWAYAKNFVLQDHMFEPNASWSLPSHLFMVSAWSACCTSHNPSSCTNALQTTHAERPANVPAYYGGEPGALNVGKKASQPIFAWTDLTYLLHKARVSWGYYVVSGTEPDCEDDAAMSCAPVAQCVEHTRDLEPAAVLRRPSRKTTSSATSRTSTASTPRPRAAPCRPSRGSSPTAVSRAPALAGQRRAGLRDQR